MFLNRAKGKCQLRYYLGTHHPHWLQKTRTPLFLSYRQLKKRKTYLKSKGPWALDSGAFTELQEFGEWRTTPEEYADRVIRFDEEIGNLQWASIQDWICSPIVLEKTGQSIKQHQKKTIMSYCKLKKLASSSPSRLFM